MRRSVKAMIIFLMVCVIFVTCAVAVLVVRYMATTNDGNFHSVSSSCSMEPTIKTGSVLVIKPVENYQVNIGDIVYVKTKDSEIPVTHRVVAVCDDDPTFIITQGDNRITNPEYDPCAISITDVTGIVVDVFDGPLIRLFTRVFYGDKITYPSADQIPEESGWTSESN